MKEMTFKRAVTLNAIAKYSTVIFQIVYIAILSRLLTPDDYGIIATVMIYMVFFQLFSDMGFGTAIVQNKALSEIDIRNIYTFTLFLGIGLAVLFAAFSYPIAWFYSNQIYVPLGIVLSVSLMFSTFNMVPNALLMRDKRFALVAVRVIVTSIVTYSMAVALAYLGFKYYSLAIQIVANSFILFAWNIVSTRIMPINRCSFQNILESIKKIWGYSIFQFLASFINYIQRNLDNFLISITFSPGDLGYYNKAYSLCQYPLTYFSHVITPILHPMYSEYQDNKEYLYQKYMRLIRILSMLGLFFSAFFFFAASEIIFLVFGSQWERSVLPFQIISICIWPQMLTATVGSIMQSLNDTKLLFKTLLVTGGISLVGITIGVLYGSIVNVAISVAVIYYLHFVIYYYALIKKGFKMRFDLFLLSFKYESIQAVIVLISMILFNAVPNNIENVLVLLIVKGLYLSIIFIIITIITKQYKLLDGVLFRLNKQSKY